MTFKAAERIRETSTTTGTGTYTLAGAPTGYQPFSALAANNYTPYFATDGTNWEAGIGQYLSGPDRLARDAVIASSNAGAAVNWAAGTRTLRCGWPAWLGMPRYLTKSVAGGAGTTALTQSEQRGHVLEFTGALTGNRVVEVDATPWAWTVFNNTTGAFTLTFRVTGQTGIVVPQGKRVQLVCDGTDVRQAQNTVAPTDFAAQSANAVLAGPTSGAAAVPTFRSLVGIESALVLLGSKVASASASLSFGTADFDWTAYDEYEFHFVDFLPATDAVNLQFQVSTDGGSTWVTTAVYSNSHVSFNGASVTANTNSGITANTIIPTQQSNNTTNGRLQLVLRASKPSNASSHKMFATEGVAFTNSSGSLNGGITAANYQSTSAYNGIKFFYSSGNIASGTIYVYGVRKS